MSFAVACAIVRCYQYDPRWLRGLLKVRMRNMGDNICLRAYNVERTAGEERAEKKDTRVL